MQKTINRKWLVTSKGDPRGFIQPQSLDELWFHTGTGCNLRCPFCLEGSHPGNNRVECITCDEARRFIDEAVELGVQKFSFTGGEPFVNPEFVDILDYALDHRMCLVLTNGTKPLIDQFERLRTFRSKPNPLNVRISLDHPDPRQHDRYRGAGNFQHALNTMGRLYKEGFGVSIARLSEADEDVDAVDAAYVPFLKKAELPTDITIIKFPDFHRPGETPEVPEITETCMTTYLTTEQRDNFMCNFSKMIVKQNGRCGVYACTLVDDDDDYNLGATLAEAMQKRVMLRHHRCFCCFSCGASCSE